MWDASIHASEAAPGGAEATGGGTRAQNMQGGTECAENESGQNSPSNTMHVTSQKQPKAAGAVLLANRSPQSKLSSVGAAGQILKSMSGGDSETKRKSFPVKAGHDGRNPKTPFVSSHHTF